MKKLIIFTVLVLFNTCCFGDDKTDKRIIALERQVNALQMQVQQVQRVQRRIYQRQCYYRTFDLDAWYQLQRRGMGNTDPDLFQ